jgi:hypothetical protein
MIKAFKKITLTLFIGSAIACSGVAQPLDQWGNQLAPQRDKRPERPVEKKRNDDRGDRGDRGGDRGGSKRDDGGRRGKRSDDRFF